jgi:hypothetical protein
MNVSILAIILLVGLALFCMAKKDVKEEGFLRAYGTSCDQSRPCPRGQRCAIDDEGPGVCITPSGCPKSCKNNAECKDGYVCRKYVPPGENPDDMPGQCIRLERPSQVPCHFNDPSSCPLGQECTWTGYEPTGACIWKGC